MCIISSQSLAVGNSYLIQGGKAYKMVEEGGELLVSNEWHPTREEGYTEEYIQTLKTETIKQANLSLKRIRE
jgi:hypothetical protein